MDEYQTVSTVQSSLESFEWVERVNSNASRGVSSGEDFVFEVHPQGEATDEQADILREHLGFYKPRVSQESTTAGEAYHEVRIRGGLINDVE